LATTTPSLVKWVACFTIIFGLLLDYTELIHESRFPEGASFILMYTWGLLAVVALPIFLLTQFYFLIRALKESREDSARSLIFIVAFALCFGAIGECVFLVSRH
jgi:hypothetical protein